MGEELTPGREADIRTRQTVRILVMTAILAVSAALVLDNRQSVTLGYIVGEREASLVVALVVAFVLGGIVGWMMSRRRTKRVD
jgi:uncharacterized membrane protein YciS (DUF1049 family)